MNTAAPTQLMSAGRVASPAVPSERVRVALVAGAATATDDLYGLLRRRLLTYSSIIAAAYAAGVALDRLLSSGRDISAKIPLGVRPTAADRLVLDWHGQFMLVVASASALALWKFPPRSLRGLRLIELLLVAATALLFLLTSVGPAYRILQAAARLPEEFRDAFVHRYALSGSLVWFIVITAYGALIPNTWRRCVAVTGTLAASPLLLFSLFSLWLRPLGRETFFGVFSMIAFYGALAVAVAVFSSSRIEFLRRQAAEARRLGQYTLRHRLGSGGMGEVYRAEHALLRRPCAIKTIRPEQAGDPARLRRFEREVQATAELTHPNTVAIYDYGHADDGTFYYVMEYLPGETLEALVARDGPLPPARAVRLLRQVCGALGEAHARGLIHRDVKPGNVMVCDRGGVPDVAKLLDFGLVLPVADDPDGTKLTRAGTVTGTPGYLSPEQAAGKPDLDPRSDIYAVGALGYFLLAGRGPFDGRSPVETLAAHLYERPKPPRETRPDIPAPLEAVILRCLAKNPADRFDDTAALDAAFAAAVSSGG